MGFLSGWAHHVSSGGSFDPSRASLWNEMHHQKHAKESAAREELNRQQATAKGREKLAMDQINASYGVGTAPADIDQQIAALTGKIDAANRPVQRTPLETNVGGHLGSMVGFAAHQLAHPNNPPPAGAAPNTGSVFGGGLFGHGLFGTLRRESADQAQMRKLIKQRDNPENKAAKANKIALDGVLAKTKQATMTSGMRTLDGGFSGALRAQRQRLAGQGLTGGSADASTQSTLIGDYLGGRQKLSAAADRGDMDARQNLNEQRQAMLRDVKLKINPGISSLSSSAQQAGDINRAYRNVGEDSIGNFISNAGQLGAQANIASGAGFTGTGAFRLNNPRPAAASGRVS